MASSSGLRVFYYNTPPNARIPTPINTTSTTSTSSPNTNPNITDTDITDTDTDRDNDGGDDTPSRSITRRPQPIPPPLAHLPTFDSRFRSTEPQFYFYHVVDTRDASLRVHVLGPGLSFTFTHERARRHLSPGRIAQGLHRKTTGFLALVRTCSSSSSGGGGSTGGGRDDIGNSNGGSPEHQQQQRTVLVWAESGHGAGRAGDMLDPTPGALPNGRWTRRAVALAALLGLRTERPFDTMGLREGQLDERARERLKGVFLASHVEVKLATHGVYALLHVFGLHRESSPLPSRRRHQRDSGSSSGSNNTIRNVSANKRPGPDPPRHRGADTGCEASRGLDLATLARLREVRWDDGSRPRLEVYFSRRNCVPCGAFVKRLSEATGVRIDLIWRERLTHVVYETRVGGGGGGGGGGGIVREPNPAAMRTAALQDGGGSMGAPEDVLMRDIQNAGGIPSAQRQQQQDDVQMLDVADLTGAASRCCIDLTGEPQTTEAPVCDLTSEGTASGVEKDGCTDDNNAAGRRGIDEDTRAAYMAAYLDGLAYCVGQLPRMTTTTSISPHGHMADATSRQGEASATQGEEAWRAVRMAIVDFAKRMLLLRRADRPFDTGRPRDGKDGTNISDAQDPSNGKTTPHDRRAARAQRRMREVNKPLPATPETRPPAWMMDIDGEEDIWEMDEVASPTVTRREAGACHGPKGANRVEGTRSGGMHGRSRVRTLGDALGGDQGTRAGSGGQRRKRAWDGSTRADACRG